MAGLNLANLLLKFLLLLINKPQIVLTSRLADYSEKTSRQKANRGGFVIDELLTLVFE